jgi:hypothetical protein
MSIWNKILLGLIFVSSLGFFYMSAWMLKTQKNWSVRAEQYAKKISDLQDEDKITEQGGTVGGEFKPGIEQLSADLFKLNVDRQRVWYKCDPQVNLNRQTGAVSIKVTVDQPSLSGIANKSIIYAFEDAPAPQGRYLGEFKVTAVADKQITLEPAFKLTPEDLKKLAEPRKPWNLYDSLPHDSHEIMEQLNNQEMEAMLPKDSVRQYIDDGKPAPSGAPAADISDGKYVRPLRDYGYLFNIDRLHITELVDRLEAGVRDNQMVDNALADAKLQVKYWQDQGKVAKAFLADMDRQLGALNDYLAKLQKKLADTNAALMELTKNNKAMAGQIAKIQLDATRRIDERTRAMAQSPNGGN